MARSFNTAQVKSVTIHPAASFQALFEAFLTSLHFFFYPTWPSRPKYSYLMTRTRAHTHARVHTHMLTLRVGQWINKLFQPLKLQCGAWSHPAEDL